jgi:hypothetical protein
MESRLGWLVGWLVVGWLVFDARGHALARLLYDNAHNVTIAPNLFNFIQWLIEVNADFFKLIRPEGFRQFCRSLNYICERGFHNGYRHSSVAFEEKIIRSEDDSSPPHPSKCSNWPRTLRTLLFE